MTGYSVTATDHTTAGNGGQTATRSGSSDGNTEATVRSVTVTIDHVAPVSTVHAGPASVQDGAPLAYVRGVATVRDSRQHKAGTIVTVDCRNSDGVKLRMSATDRGSGLAGLTYAATGAQTTKPTTTGALPTNLTITRSGFTTATYYATARVHASGGGRPGTTLSSDQLGQTGPSGQGLLIVALLLVVSGVVTCGATVFGGARRRDARA